jgi:DNA topoisomerase-1
MKLVIVESPAKCAKIQGFLGDGYKVQATMGHIRALEESLDSVGIDRGWDPTYKELETKRDAIAKLRSAAKGCEIILASDDDREGEAIAWHVCFILKLNPATTPRIVFHEITKPAILAAVAAPRRLDLAKVNAQQARSMLDLLVGFTISRVLWNRVAPKLSAGRCQTPALRLVVERDAEVDKHRAAAYWRLSGKWAHPTKPVLPPLHAAAAADLPTAAEAEAALRTVHTTPKTTVTAVKESVSTSAPPKPLITSTLQQEASSSHGLGPKVTMQAAQKLYEAGHITYMRTDNPMLSQEAATAIRGWVTTTHGPEFVGEPGQHTIAAAAATVEHVETPAPKKAKAKAKAPETATTAPEKPEAQAAHEAIRPTHPELPEPAIEDPTQRTVYKLIWRRAVQSQMAPSTTDVRKATLAIEGDPTRLWTAEQTQSKFLGWRVLDRRDADREAAEERAYAEWAAVLKPAAILQWKALQADEQFTKPKGRYTEASLIADLEKKGIGRPSTFASLVSTILDREYIEKTNVEGKTQDSRHLTIAPSQWPPTESLEHHTVGAEKNKVRATPLGTSVSTFLAREYADLFNYEFTASMEQDLDNIAKDTKPWKSLLQETWDKYKERYAEQTAGSAGKAARERVLAEGIKVILSRKGPLFVKDPPAGSPKTAKATFASLPSSVTFESATEADAITAFAQAAESRAGELLGILGTDEIRKKKGPYGLYAECKGARIPLKGDEPLEQIQEKLTAKLSFKAGETETAFSRVVGEFTVKRGPYGLYFYKQALKRAQFVKFPTTLNHETVKEAELKTAYSAGLQAKKRFVKKE